jgi:hypothetical protein
MLDHLDTGIDVGTASRRDFCLEYRLDGPWSDSFSLLSRAKGARVWYSTNSMRDQAEGDKLIGILLERRNDPERIDLKSIMKWPGSPWRQTDIDNVYVVTMAPCDGADGDFAYRRNLIGES